MHADEPWRMCIGGCMCQGSFIHGRISSSIIYRGLSERADRVAVPLPFGRRGGLILRPSHARLDCFYGIDGGTYRLNRAELPGCSSSFCDPTQPWQGGQLCGFNGCPATAWRPADLRQALELHKQHGASYHAPGFHSGYNEAVLSSRHHNEHLPRSVEAFFVLSGASAVTADLGYGIRIDVADAHRRFLEAFGLSATQVPLLRFDPTDWDAPFADY